MRKDVRRNVRAVLLTLILTVFAAPSAFSQVEVTDKIRPTPKLPPDVKIDPKTVTPIACPDPSALELEGNLVSRSSTWPEFEGRIDIVGIVRNVGRGNYASGGGQQIVELLEESPGSTPRVIRSAAFTNLNAGADVRVSYQRNWSVGSEFPPRYMLRIAYDPDIRIDGNAANDDCRLDNNQTAIEPREISILFD